jgi:hypothetical protein
MNTCTYRLQFNFYSIEENYTKISEIYISNKKNRDYLFSNLIMFVMYLKYLYKKNLSPYLNPCVCDEGDLSNCFLPFIYHNSDKLFL